MFFGRYFRGFWHVSRSSILIAAAAGVLGLVGPISSSVVSAQEFPSKPIKVIVPFKPGGRTDVVARLIAEKIKEKGWLTQPMVVVNVDGGAGANAVNQMRREEADGHTIVHWHHELLIATAMGLGNFGPDDFKSIGYTGGGSPVWAVREDAPFDTLDELVAHLKEKPRSLVEAVGIGSIPHFVGAILAKEAGFETRYVTANSGADRLRLLLGGNADIALFAASEYLAQGKGLKALVYFGRERLPSLPDVSTARELGYDVTWANPNWWLAPAGTPDEAVKVLAGALEKAIQDPEIVEYFRNNTLEPYWVGGEEAMEDARKTLEQLKTVAATIR
ncbi:tripartite tricarboxylate transporter substrate binding protein [Mesorhizobium sp. RMAD-H1]|uniref:Bug family tripartite tricarboxylate transporter substrate binding protein n=1 Tax=Mesorhizobium sp. RMAD-H1 TaxID=2587065 RepID=UPI0016097954|nr:tripartite tricarboxylate transporter substrate binding protein [Mesorhizobium sp. RMAD-H1]MBB2974299.1 tripartite-type tricarboxylate transporter receptor subunit TctC [Mesorhizobium sp. RMAD-H1]